MAGLKKSIRKKRKERKEVSRTSEKIAAVGNLKHAVKKEIQDEKMPRIESRRTARQDAMQSVHIIMLYTIYINTKYNDDDNNKYKQ